MRALRYVQLCDRESNGVIGMDRPVVTVITPTFNHERYIAECIRSVQSQTFADWEQIIVDDGSTDGTREAVAETGPDPRRRLIVQENKGIWRLAETYNVALSQAMGKYVAILEGDDYWPEDTLKILVTQMEQLGTAYAVVYGQARTIGVRSGSLVGTSRMPNEYERPEDFSHQIYTPVAGIPPQASLIRRDVLDQIGGFSQPPSLPLVDRPTFLILSLKWKFFHIKSELAYWRQHSSNVTSVYALQMAAGAIPWVNEFFDALPKTTAARLRVSRRATVRIHRSLVFRMVGSYLQELQNDRPLESRWADVEKYAIRYLARWQMAVLYLEIAYLRAGIDLRGLSFIKRLLDRL